MTSRWACAASLVGIFGCGLGLGARETPPSLEFDTEVVAISSRPLRTAGQLSENSSTQTAAISGLVRQALAPGWYWSLGGGAETFWFPGDSGSVLPRRLQDVSARLALGYFEKDENVADLELRPGWYYGDHLTNAAWDVPVDFSTGIPLGKNFDGVVGVSNARFYHHAIPVLGLVWTPRPGLRLEAVFPEPAVVINFNEMLTLRVGGELAGGGFLVGSAGHHRVLEYSSYRVGGSVDWKIRERLRVTLAAGVEAERDFDFFRQNQRWHGSGAGYGKIGVEFSR